MIVLKARRRSTRLVWVSASLRLRSTKAMKPHLLGHQSCFRDRAGQSVSYSTLTSRDEGLQNSALSRGFSQMTKESKPFSSSREVGGRGDNCVEGQEKIYKAALGKCFAPS